jgi:archaellum biogenesis protein FlaJ (TadC family)
MSSLDQAIQILIEKYGNDYSKDAKYWAQRLQEENRLEEFLAQRNY